MPDLQVIRNVRPLGAAAVDVVVERATIDSIGPTGSADARLPSLVDGGGELLLPALVESHVHFDKTLWGCRGARTPRVRPATTGSRTSRHCFAGSMSRSRSAPGR